jgi:hypothetical protein
MSMEVKNTKNLSAPFVSILNYGQSKAGKTYFFRTWPDGLMISFEPGLISLRDSNVDYVEPGSWNEVLAIVQELVKSAKPGSVTYQGKTYRSLAIDPLNEFYNLIMKSVLSMTPGRELPKQPDWGLSHDRFERTIREVEKLPVHKYYTCLEFVQQDELTGRILGLPLLPGKMAEKAPALFDYIFHAQTEQKKGGGTNYIVATAAESFYLGGGRYGARTLDAHEVPDFNIIYEKLTGGKP